MESGTEPIMMKRILRILTHVSQYHCTILEQHERSLNQRQKASTMYIFAYIYDERSSLWPGLLLNQ